VEFKADLNRATGVGQAATVGASLNAKVCISTDGHRSLWFLPDVSGAFHPLHDETGAELKEVFVSPEGPKVEQVQRSARLIKDIDERLDGDRLSPRRSLNPSALARSVWQDIYMSANTPPPDRALATFVEIFMFKYLSDLGVLTTDPNGTDISFEAVLAKSSEQCLRYYSKNVRWYIKSIFPSGHDDGTTIITSLRRFFSASRIMRMTQTAAN
jgi:type I restriction enzyme M protein